MEDATTEEIREAILKVLRRSKEPLDTNSLELLVQRELEPKRVTFKLFTNGVLDLRPSRIAMFKKGKFAGVTYKHPHFLTPDLASKLGVPH